MHPFLFNDSWTFWLWVLRSDNWCCTDYLALDNGNSPPANFTLEILLLPISTWKFSSCQFQLGNSPNSTLPIILIFALLSVTGKALNGYKWLNMEIRRWLQWLSLHYISCAIFFVHYFHSKIVWGVFYFYESFSLFSEVFSAFNWFPQPVIPKNKHLSQMFEFWPIFFPHWQKLEEASCTSSSFFFICQFPTWFSKTLLEWRRWHFNVKASIGKQSKGVEQPRKVPARETLLKCGYHGSINTKYKLTNYKYSCPATCSRKAQIQRQYRIIIMLIWFVVGRWLWWNYLDSLHSYHSGRDAESVRNIFIWILWILSIPAQKWKILFCNSFQKVLLERQDMVRPVKTFL